MKKDLILAGSKLEMPENYREDEKYVALAEDCRAIRVTRIFNSRMEVIIGASEVGERVVSDQYWEKWGKGNQGFARQLARDIEMSYQELLKCVQLFEKYGVFEEKSQNWDNFKEGNNISWTKIKQGYLPNSPKKSKGLKCRYCPIHCK